MGTERRISTLTIVLAGITLTSAFSVYRERIPNGGQVPHPCKPNYLWKGVGHVNPLGGGSRNAFGADFLRLGAQWSVELCQLDSDGDGMTNGQELGDPECTWTSGSLPSRTSGITHPGVCDPWDDSRCQVYNAWIDCSVDDLRCPYVENEPEVLNMTLRFPQTAVPDTETNYLCMTFDLPSDDVYDLIATEPFIDNAQVMHHILLHSCEDPSKLPNIPVPQACGMEAGGRCNSIIGGWTVGSTGDCHSDQYGYRFGKGHFTRVVLEFHWNNPERRADYTDSSGMILYYTRNLRPNSAATLVVGQMVLDIPPLQPSVSITGSCPASCSSLLFTQPFYVSGAVNHMHYLGRSQKVELFRNGQKITDITNDEVFSYDSPVFVEHKPPIEVRPGDDLKTTCVYSSMYRNETVRYGDGTNDEMCYAFITVYPKEALRFGACVGFGERSICDLYLGGGGDGEEGEGEGEEEKPTTTTAQPGDVIEGCNWREFSDQNGTAFETVLTQLYNSCEAFGSCTRECEALLRRYRNNPCLHGKAWEAVKGSLVSTHYGMLAVAYVESCPHVLCPRCPQC